MSGRMYGYARVSTRMQKEDRQLTALTQFGVAEEYIVVEKQSGKDFNRPLYKELLKKMSAHDVLVVKSIDRLGRNYGEILEQWAYLTKERGISIVVLDMPLLDTREGRDLTGTLVADIVLQLLSYVAQTEREFMRQRQAEGIRAAKARGVRFGRERISMPVGFEDLAEDWWNGYISATDGGKQMGVSRDTFLRRVKEWGVEYGYTDPGLPPNDMETDLKQIQESELKLGTCNFVKTPTTNGVNQVSSGVGYTPRDQSYSLTGGFSMNDVKITYVNHSSNREKPIVFMFAKNDLPAFDALQDGVAWRTFEGIEYGSRATATFPVNTEICVSWDYGSQKSAMLAAEIGGSYSITKDSSGIVLSRNGNAGNPHSIEVINDTQVDGGVSVDLYKDGRRIMSRSIVDYRQKTAFVLSSKLYCGLAFDIREGDSLSSAVLSSVNFYELDLNGLSEVTIGLNGNAQDGYKFDVEFTE